MVINQIICSLALKPKTVPSYCKRDLAGLAGILEREPETGREHCRIEPLCFLVAFCADDIGIALAESINLNFQVSL
jgi:hypothetical protein